jgi:hypothetical protein
MISGEAILQSGELRYTDSGDHSGSADGVMDCNAFYAIGMILFHFDIVNHTVIGSRFYFFDFD